MPIVAEQSAVHPIDCRPSVVAPGLGVGNAAPQRLGRHFDQEVVAGLLIDEQQELLGEVFQVDGAFTTGVQPHAGLADLVVEDDRVHGVFTAHAVRMPRQHRLERAGLGRGQQGGQPGPVAWSYRR